MKRSDSHNQIQILQAKKILFCKDLGDKFQELTHLKFSSILFVSEGMSHENQQLAYKCQKLKTTKKIYCIRFFNNVVNLMLTEYGRI